MKKFVNVKVIAMVLIVVTMVMTYAITIAPIIDWYLDKQYTEKIIRKQLKSPLGIFIWDDYQYYHDRYGYTIDDFIIWSTEDDVSELRE